MNRAKISVVINKRVIENFLTVPNYQVNVDNKVKLKIMSNTAVYDNQPIAQLDWDEKTVSIYTLATIRGFAKQMQTILKNRAVELGFNVVMI